MWFLLLGGRGAPRWFSELLTQLRTQPARAAAFFAVDPFAGRPPERLRVAVYRYTFSDVDTRRRTGAWWTRVLEGHF
jgi:hypothetical protein